ncbi:MAG: calcium-binding protein [Clostridiales bacterium]|nr:calcium-binding protein [Clostridiales bacterium]
MKFSKEDLLQMRFDDPVPLPEPDDDDDDDDIFEDAEECCIICGNEIANLKISFNEKEQLYKYECANCKTIYVMPENARMKDSVLLQGEERDWPAYLQETLAFPFNAFICESNDREFFDPHYDGPRLYDAVKVLEVFYSLKYGVEAVIRKGRKVYSQILCFLEVEDFDSRNYEEIENYKRWREKYWLSDFLVALADWTKEARQEQDE